MVSLVSLVKCLGGVLWYLSPVPCTVLIPYFEVVRVVEVVEVVRVVEVVEVARVVGVVGELKVTS